MASASRWLNAGAIARCTRKRFAAVQASPPLRILAIIAPATAASRSASSNTMKGALPPNSIEQLTTQSAASRSNPRPTSVDPVNDSLRTRGSCSIADTSGPDRRDGTVIRTAVEGISRMGRPTQGVRLMNLRGDDTVSSIARVSEPQPVGVAGDEVADVEMDADVEESAPE